MLTESATSPDPAAAAVSGPDKRWRPLLYKHKRTAAAMLLLVLTVAALLLWPRHPAWPLEVQRDQLEMRGGRLFLPGESRPYSGLLTADYPGTKQRKSALPLQDGRISGLVRGWHENGKPDVEEPFQDGVSHGLRTRWHDNGAKRSEAEIVRGKLQGRYTEWHAGGQKKLEMTLKDGKAEGLAEAWHASGRLKSRTRMLHGDVKESHFFADDAASTPLQPGETATASASDAHE